MTDEGMSLADFCVSLLAQGLRLVALNSRCLPVVQNSLSLGGDFLEL